MIFGKSKREQEREASAHNDKLIDLCYRMAVRVCRRAEGFDPAESFIDWDLPSNEEFRAMVRKARGESYRQRAVLALYADPDKGNT